MQDMVVFEGVGSHGFMVLVILSLGGHEHVIVDLGFMKEGTILMKDVNLLEWHMIGDRLVVKITFRIE